MATYVIAVKREWRADVAPDWIDALRDAPGVELTGAASEPRARTRTDASAATSTSDPADGPVHDAAGNPGSDPAHDVAAARAEPPAGTRTDALAEVRPAPRRVIVRATEDGIAELRVRVGAFCHIEPLIAHDPGEP